MERHIVVIGCGTTGTLAANLLHRTCAGGGVRVVAVDRTDHRDPQTELLVTLGLFGGGTLRPPDDVRLREGVEFHHAAVASVDTGRAELRLADGTVLGYDALVLATGRHPLPPGLGGGYPSVPRPAYGPAVYAVGAAAAGPGPAGGAAFQVQAGHLVDAVRRQLARGAAEPALPAPLPAP